MELNGLHLLLTYQCTFECDHCFAWGSPWQSGTMTISSVHTILKKAKEAEFVRWIYFEGGEPFLYYQTLLAGVNEAVELGFNVGIVTNSYWATSEEDAFLFLSPFKGKINDLTISSDLFHYNEKVSQQSQRVSHAAELLEIPLGVICIEQPESKGISVVGQIPPESTSIMYRGRAAEKLTGKTTLYPAKTFTDCPHEDLNDPGRVHIDPLGYLHICQGISIGNIFNSSLQDLCTNFDAKTNPIIGPLVDGGPVNLANQYGILLSENYADACHLCYKTRLVIRNRFPDILTPDQMYGIMN